MLKFYSQETANSSNVADYDYMWTWASPFLYTCACQRGMADICQCIYFKMCMLQTLSVLLF